jgi:adenine-specific DNA-methyltransferase
MTPAPIASFMASLFETLSADAKLLDPGAGVGSLAAAFTSRWLREASGNASLNVNAFEINVTVLPYLHDTLKIAQQSIQPPLSCKMSVSSHDFVLATAASADSLFFENVGARYSHVIMNPPYKKIGVNSSHRIALKSAGVDVSNLYAGFMFLAAEQLLPGGELVAIIPRSFCNGPYFRDFRNKFFDRMSLRRIHLFASRSSAFKGDAVLQENVILYATKDQLKPDIAITSSRDSNFQFDEKHGGWFAEDMTERIVPYHSVFPEGDPNRFVFIAANDVEQGIVARMNAMPATLQDLEIQVSTGPVVDFRLKSDLSAQPAKGAVPLLYPQHFTSSGLDWPRDGKKPNAIRISEHSARWLWANEGHLVVTKRFTAKEEKRRVVATVYDGSLPGDLIGFENHLNLFHTRQRGLDRDIANGIAAYLNSSLVDRYFRLFNGHTQVNATDLRALRYPDLSILKRIGKAIGNTNPSQSDIDGIIEKESKYMAKDIDPIQTQQKIEEALTILKAMGIPRGQQNKRSALTLLALLDLVPTGSWNALGRPMIGITPIMDFCREKYGENYAPNTRETFRRQTMHQFVEAGLAIYNPDKPNRPPNSPQACYQISDEAFAMIQTFGSETWEEMLAVYLEGQPSLAAKWAKHRNMQKIPVQVADGFSIDLVAGSHSELIRDIITEFAPRFAPGAEVIYIGDTGEKMGYFREERLAELGVTVDKHGKMPDVLLYYSQKNWLLLVESVTSHGPVDSKRYSELAELFAEAKVGLVYVTAFPNRSVMGRFLSEISWETEVWCADAPTHLIHFNGERFLGPYDGAIC